MTQDKIIKVDRVFTVEEALRLESVGATIVSVMLLQEDDYNETRAVTKDCAASIRKYLKTAKFCIEMYPSHWESPNFLPWLLEIRPDYVQVIHNYMPSLETQVEYSSHGFRFFIDRYEVSSDYDPDWIIPLPSGALKSSIFQVDVFGDYLDSWEALNTIFPDIPDEINAKDVDDKAKEHNMVITTNFSPKNVENIITSLPHVLGFYLMLRDFKDNSNSSPQPAPTLTHPPSGSTIQVIMTEGNSFTFEQALNVINLLNSQLGKPTN